MVKKIVIVAVVAAILISVMAVFALLPADRGDSGDSATTTPADNVTPGDNVTPENDETTAPAVESNIPEDLSFGKAEVSFLYWDDHTMNEFFVEEISGDIIGDQIYERNGQVQDQLGVTLTFTPTAGSANYMGDFAKVVETDITSGACDYDIIAGYSRTAPLLTLSGMTAELSDLKYLDFTSPWWSKALIDECTINDRLYYCSGDISTNLLWMMTASFFNKDLIDRYGLEDPYQLVKDNKWTIDKMFEMTGDRYNDLDGGSTVDEGDFFGSVIYSINIDAFFTSSGVIALEKNASGELIASPTLTDQKTYDLIDKLGKFLNTPDCIYADDTGLRNIFFEERALFITDRVFIVAGKDHGNSAKIEFEYGIVPVPKYSSDQAEYYTSVGHPFTMYAISVAVENNETLLDACDATLELMGQKGYELVTPAVFETAMKVKYAHDNDASAMYDILRENVRFDMGRLYSAQIGDVYKVMRNEAYKASNTFASQYKGLSRAIENGINKIMAAYVD